MSDWCGWVKSIFSNSPPLADNAPPLPCLFPTLTNWLTDYFSGWFPNHSISHCFPSHLHLPLTIITIPTYDVMILLLYTIDNDNDNVPRHGEKNAFFSDTSKGSTISSDDYCFHYCLSWFWQAGIHLRAEPHEGDRTLISSRNVGIKKLFS